MDGKTATPGPAVRARLQRSEAGLALLELLSQFDSRTDLAKRLGAPKHELENWIERGVVPEKWAERIEERIKGWTRERIRPDMKEFQWRRSK